MNVLNIAMVSAVLFSSIAFSDTHADKRQEHQGKRIEEGVKSGTLNENEQAKLEAGQDKVEAAEVKMMEDGKATHKEKRHLNHMQNRQSKKIHRMKHNN